MYVIQNRNDETGSSNYNHKLFVTTHNITTFRKDSEWVKARPPAAYVRTPVARYPYNTT